MSDALRPPSARPTVLVDEQSRSLEIGRAGPLGRERIVACLPFADDPRLMVGAALLADERGGYVVDPDGNLVGRPAVWVSRILSAAPVEATRRLG